MVLFAQQRPKMRENLTRDIGAWVHSLSYKDLSPEVIDSVKRICLDYIGQGLAGSTGKGIGATGLRSIAPEIALAKLHPGGATVLGTDINSLPHYAALANGAFGHVHTLQDTHREAVPTHIGCTIFPTAFAVSQMIEIDFPTFATAVAAGFEITAKLAMALRPGHGTIDTIQSNTLGAAIMAGKLLGLDQQRLTDCLGVGTFVASGSFEFLSEPGYWTRAAQVGWAAYCGIVAALLAKSGLQGSPRVVEAPYGFLNSFSDSPDGTILDRLGTPFEITRTGMKLYPTTRYAQAEQRALLRIVKKNHVQAKDVKRLTIEKPLAMWEVTGTDAQKRPATAEIARLSSYYFAAVILLRGSAWLDALEPDVFNAKETWEMVDRVHVIHNSEFDKEFPAKYTSRVTIDTFDGRTLTDIEYYSKGDPEEPLTTSEIVGKATGLYDYCLTDVMTRERFDEIVDRTLKMENEHNIGDFIRIMAPDKNDHN
jgi:2-methylcitrate dehydratase PrpD